MPHNITHPDSIVPNLFNHADWLDVSWHHDECPCFLNERLGVFIYWHETESQCEGMAFQSDDGCIGGDLAQFFSHRDLTDWLAYRESDQ